MSQDLLKLPAHEAQLCWNSGQIPSSALLRGGDWISWPALGEEMRWPGVQDLSGPARTPSAVERAVPRGLSTGPGLCFARGIWQSHWGAASGTLRARHGRRGPPWWSDGWGGTGAAGPGQPWGWHLSVDGRWIRHVVGAVVHPRQEHGAEHQDPGGRSIWTRGELLGDERSQQFWGDHSCAAGTCSHSGNRTGSWNWEPWLQFNFNRFCVKWLHINTR